MHRIKKLYKSTIFKNLSFLVLGTLIAQLIIIGFQMILRRLFTPAEFGAFAVYMSIIGIIATVSSLRYEQVIVIPANEQKAYNLLWLSLGISVLVSVFVGVIMILFIQNIISWLQFPVKYQLWLYFVPFSVLLLSFYQAMNYYMIRLKLFRASGSNKVERRIAEGVTQTISGKLGIGLGLVWGDLTGQFVNALAAWIKIRKKLRHLNVSWANICQVANEYKGFPLKNGLPSLLNAMSLLLPVIFINRLFDEQVTGFFDLAKLILILPLSLITASMSQVMLQRFSELRNQRLSIKKEARNIAFGLGALALMFILVVFFFGPFLLTLVFGDVWSESGIYARILVWAFALKFVVSPFNMVFTVFEKIGILSIWQVLYFSLIVLLAIIPTGDIKNFLFLYMSVEIVASTIAGILTFRVIRKYEYGLLASLKSESHD